MSRRSGKGNKEKKTRQQKPRTETEPPPKKPFALLRRRRVLLAALAGMVAMILMAVLGGRQPPRITVVNKTGEPLTGLRLEFQGGSIESDPVPEGGKTSVLLRPEPGKTDRPGSGPVTLFYHVGNGPRNRFMSRVHGQDYGAHDIITIARDPTGQVVVTPSPPGGWGISFRELLRRVGIRI